MLFELRRGLPRVSPALLSQRLKELKEAEIVEKTPIPGEPGANAYSLTEAGMEHLHRGGEQDQRDRRTMRTRPIPPFPLVIVVDNRIHRLKPRLSWTLALSCLDRHDALQFSI